MLIWHNIQCNYLISIVFQQVLQIFNCLANFEQQKIIQIESKTALMSLAPKSFMRCSSKRNSNRQLKNQLDTFNSDNVNFKNQKINLLKKQEALHILKSSSQKSIKKLSTKGSHSIPILSNTVEVRHSPTVIQHLTNRYSIIYKHKSQQLQSPKQNLNFLIQNPQKTSTYQKIHSDRSESIKKSSSTFSAKSKRTTIYSQLKGTFYPQNWSSQIKKLPKIYPPFDELLIKGKNIYDLKNNCRNSTPIFKQSPLLTISYF